IKTEGVKGKLMELLMGPNALNNKTYSFDGVFSPAAGQDMIFDEVVKPILDEVRGGSSLCLGPVSGAKISFLTLSGLLRCWRASTAPSSRTDRPARGRHTPCLATSARRWASSRTR